MKETERPKNAIVMETYAELDEYVRAFAEGLLKLLIVVGKPGIQKTRVVNDAIGDGACWIEGQATPFGIYRLLYAHRNEVVILDDVDSLCGSRDGIRLLKCLCQTEPRKVVSWHTNTTMSGQEDVPPSFVTTSRVALIANEWHTLNRNVQAVEDRGICIAFSPSVLEVHMRTARWFWDQQIFDFIGEHLHLFTELSMRLYENAWRVKRSGLDWRTYILKRTGNDKVHLVASLKRDKGLLSEEDRAKAFVSRGGGCRATYFSYARLLQNPDEVPRIRLASRPPEEVESALAPSGIPTTERGDNPDSAGLLDYPS